MISETNRYIYIYSNPYGRGCTKFENKKKIDNFSQQRGEDRNLLTDKNFFITGPLDHKKLFLPVLLMIGQSHYHLLNKPMAHSLWKFL